MYFFFFFFGGGGGVLSRGGGPKLQCCLSLVMDGPCSPSQLGYFLVCRSFHMTVCVYVCVCFCFCACLKLCVYIASLYRFPIWWIFKNSWSQNAPSHTIHMNHTFLLKKNISNPHTSKNLIYNNYLLFSIACT